MMTVLWSAMPSTTFSFFINPGLFVKTRYGETGRSAENNHAPKV